MVTHVQRRLQAILAVGMAIIAGAAAYEFPTNPIRL